LSVTGRLSQAVSDSALASSNAAKGNGRMDFEVMGAWSNGLAAAASRAVRQRV
jgi:hypothetical protein